VEFWDFGQATTIPICNWIFLKLFWWMGNSKGFLTSHYMQDSDTFCISYDVFFFPLSNEGMLSATAIAAEFAQNCQILSKSTHSRAGPHSRAELENSKIEKLSIVNQQVGKILLLLDVACPYARFTRPMTFCVLSMLLNS
jgi:hypothetical protein